MGIHAAAHTAARIIVATPQFSLALMIPATAGPTNDPQEYEKTKRPNAWVDAPKLPKSLGRSRFRSAAAAERSDTDYAGIHTSPKPLDCTILSVEQPRYFGTGSTEKEQEVALTN